jgi:EAL domain-containing protein (putative c-di-GMP-specific phosphodiesterase class I)/CheY-like chemotaxis protein
VSDSAHTVSEATRKRLVVIDDDPDAGDIICVAARMAGFDATRSTTFDEFTAALAEPVSVLVVDLVMPGTDGIELLRYLVRQQCRAGIVLTSGFDAQVLESAERTARAMGLRVLGHLPKPMRVAELVERLRQFGAAAVDAAPTPSGGTVAVSPDELEHGIDHDQLVVHYQPQIDLRTMTIIGIEALVRWNHPVHGLLFPDRFLRMAESAGLMDALTRTVLGCVLKDSKHLADNGALQTYSINLSAKSLRNLNLPDEISNAAAQSGVAASQLIIEITETELIGELALALDILTRLRMKGVQVSIDDFGVGYSTLRQVHLIPANELKIDKSFVIASHSDDTARIMVQKTIELGRELGLRVVAEGVETPASLDLVRRYGCDIAQGYFFTRPLPLTSFTDWRSNWTGSKH